MTTFAFHSYAARICIDLEKYSTETHVLRYKSGYNKGEISFQSFIHMNVNDTLQFFLNIDESDIDASKLNFSECESLNQGNYLETSNSILFKHDENILDSVYVTFDRLNYYLLRGVLPVKKIKRKFFIYRHSLSKWYPFIDENMKEGEEYILNGDKTDPDRLALKEIRTYEGKEFYIYTLRMNEESVSYCYAYLKGVGIVSITDNESDGKTYMLMYVDNQLFEFTKYVFNNLTSRGLWHGNSE